MMRRSDLCQLAILGGALLGLTTFVLLAQSQDAINATIIERMNGFEFRLGRIENLFYGLMVAQAGNIGVHVYEITLRKQPRNRRDG